MYTKLTTTTTTAKLTVEVKNRYTTKGILGNYFTEAVSEHLQTRQDSNHTCCEWTLHVCNTFDVTIRYTRKHHTERAL